MQQITQVAKLKIANFQGKQKGSTFLPANTANSNLLV